MNATRARQFRSQRAEELRRLARILQEADLVRDASPLLRAADQLGDYGGLSWGYAFADLEFDLKGNSFRHTKPNRAKLDFVELSVLLRGVCLDVAVADDPFDQLTVNVLLMGKDVNDEPLMAAWHLDKHEGGDSEFQHPDYHLHYGGKKVREAENTTPGFSYGSLLLLETPRPEHKPLDGILAVDFVLGNFLGPAWRKLRTENERYGELIFEAEKRCCRAYHQAALARLRG